MLEFIARLLEINRGTYKENEYANAILRSEEVADGSMLKYKLDLKSVDYDSLHDMLDTDVTVRVKLVKGANSTASLKVVAIRA